jgi:hypothetical protein
MNHNLTPKQLDSLRWLINQIEVGEIGESIIAGEGSSIKGTSTFFIVNFRGEIPGCLDLGVLDALVADGAFVVNGEKYTVTKRAFEIIAFDFENPYPDPLRTFILKTYRLMSAAFNRGEFSQLCFELNVNPEWAFGDSRDWPFELLQYLYRHNRLDELPPILQQKRPKIDWPVFPVDSGQG